MMSIKQRKIAVTVSVILLAFISMPYFSSAQDLPNGSACTSGSQCVSGNCSSGICTAGSGLSFLPIVPACGDLLHENNVTNDDHPCGWQDLVSLANNLLQFMLYIAIPIAAICFAWAGWLYLSARGNPGQISRAHGIFLNVGIGLIIVMVAWLVVNLIMTTLVDTGTYIPILEQ